MWREGEGKSITAATHSIFLPIRSRSATPARKTI